MANKVVLVLVASFLIIQCYANVINRKQTENVLDTSNKNILVYNKEAGENSVLLNTQCCSTCIYIPDIGCIDPSDPSIHPPLMKLQDDKLTENA
ncbi:hypothetical protein GWI33_011412 [Rhynchophorus ferrugineus]|uniref:Uncharacterized protein n=1 Tax=Rhynchophorus ferrugineus TaxID=354439 RepID=A0A834MIR1_RHYFE|nr:hypothetical protein GWI33_011412 [Rhynchophorus ferrugineus]